MPSTIHGRLILNYSLNFLSAILLICMSKWPFRRYPISSLTLTIINCFLSGVFASIALKCIPKISTNTQTSSNRFKSIFRLLLISGLFSAFITFSNLSLQLNTIGAYQLIKLQVSPTLMLIEYLQLRFRFNSLSLTRDHFHRNYPFSVLAAFYIIFLGTLANTHSDLHFHPSGVIFACMSVICNASYQLLVQDDKVSSLYERTRFLQIQSLTSTLILFPK